MKNNYYYSPIVGEQSYQNPIVLGDYPDPSILQDGEDYYLITSVCGEQSKLMPMFHSKDLISWKLIYHVFEGLYREDFGKEMLTAWAPELIKHGDIYYIYNYSPKFGTWVTTCEDIAKGNWSAPIKLEVEGIDPGHAVDEDGKRYLCMSKNIIYPLSDDGLRAVGEGRKLCEDYPMPDSMDIEGICTESPKFYKRGGYYYLLTAQGGTMGPPTSHCVVAYRSKTLLGEYELSPHNPVVHTYSRSDKWWSTGHGTLIDYKDKTYILFHGIQNGHRYLGRQLLMMPVNWTTDGWFTIEQNYANPQPLPTKIIPSDDNNTLDINPADGKLSVYYNYDEMSVAQRITFTKNYVVFRCNGSTQFDSKALIYKAQNYSYQYELEVDISDKNANIALGCFFTDTVNCGVCIEDKMVKLFKHATPDFAFDNVKLKNSRVTLKTTCNHGTVAFYYKDGDDKYVKFKHAYDIADWNPNFMRGFGFVRNCIMSYGSGDVHIIKAKYTAI